MKANSQNRLVLTIGSIFVLIGLAGYCISQKAPDIPLRIYYNTPGGGVLFTHTLHTKPEDLKCGDPLKLDDITCTDCHHELILANHVKSCDQCHADDGYRADDMSHQELQENHPPSCKFCHESKKAQVSSCRKCHGKTGETKPVSCDKCHKDQGYSKDDMTHEELEEIEGHWCNECHETRRISDAIHFQCNKCHNKVECGTYYRMEDAPNEEAFRCALCHLSTH